MFALIFYWDYPTLHDSSAELVLTGRESSKVSLARLNSPAHLFTMMYEGVSSPSVASMSWFTYFGVKPL